MKAILVIDMPDDDLNDYTFVVEIIKNGVIPFSAEDLAWRYRIVQAKPMPEKKKETDYNAYKSGWNACIDEILGEQE